MGRYLPLFFCNQKKSRKTVKEKFRPLPSRSRVRLPPKGGINAPPETERFLISTASPMGSRAVFQYPSGARPPKVLRTSRGYYFDSSAKGAHSARRLSRDWQGEGAPAPCTDLDLLSKLGVNAATCRRYNPSVFSACETSRKSSSPYTGEPRRLPPQAVELPKCNPRLSPPLAGCPHPSRCSAKAQHRATFPKGKALRSRAAHRICSLRGQRAEVCAQYAAKCGESPFVRRKIFYFAGFWAAAA